MIHRAAAVALVAVLASPFTSAAQTPPGGHQVTPQIVNWVIAKTVSPPQNGDFTSTGYPTVVEVGGVYTVAFRGSVEPSTELGLYYWDTTMASPLLAFEEGDFVPSIELPAPVLPFSGMITGIDGGVPPAISTNGSIAQLVMLSSGLVRRASLDKASFGMPSLRVSTR